MTINRRVANRWQVLRWAACALLPVIALTSATRAQDSEPWGVSLLDADSLVGWDQGLDSTRRWTLKGNVLRGEEGTSLIVAEYSFGDFEIRYDVITKSRERLQVYLLNANDGRVVMTRNLDDPFDQVQSVHVRRVGSVVGMKVNDGATSTSEVPETARLVPAFWHRWGAATITNVRVEEAEGEPIFNGKDLAGWWTPGNKESWPVVDGELVCVNKNGNYLRTEEEFENFTLSFEYKIAKGGNSGVGIRTPRNGWPSGDGMELQLMDEKPGAPLTRHSTMAIYGNLPPLVRADKSEEWNRVVVKADGYMISAWVNGMLVQHANTAELPELKHRNLKGWIGFQDHGARTQFRNIKVLRAPPGRGLEQWYAERPRQGSEVVVDRLMNLDTLTKRDGMSSGFMSKKVTGPDETVLADLDGPGAVVEIHRTNDSGRVALYFDGEDQPRVECAAKDLASKLPLLGEDRRPLLAYVPYRKSLRVVLRDAKPGDYRIEYVNFPRDVPVEEFTGPATTTARGLLPALSYRWEQHGWGTVREFDPLPRAAAEKKTIEPGSTLPMVSLEGTGIVEWLRLSGGNKLLQNDDLWLTVTIDGESTPAIEAPARYFFPGLADGKKYRNFVVTSKGGFINRLPMPYGSGLTIAAINKGKKPIKDVSLTVSYQPATDANRAEIAGRMRLRGQFTSGASEQFFSQPGRGRWVGLICGLDDGESFPAVTALEQDGLPYSAWSAPSWDALLGLTPNKLDDRRFCCGRLDGLAWRYMLLAPVEFEKSLVLKGAANGNRLALFYMSEP